MGRGSVYPIRWVCGFTCGWACLRPDDGSMRPLHRYLVAVGVAGLLVTIPVLCMGVFAPTAAVLASKVGTTRAVSAPKARCD